MKKTVALSAADGERADARFDERRKIKWMDG
jgi:hypothetical protein